MKPSPLILCLGFVVVATGGFIVGKISSGPDDDAPQTADASKPERLRSSDRGSSGAGGDSAAKSRGTRESSGGRVSMSEKLAKMETIMRSENPLDRNRALLALIDQLGPGDFEDVVAQFRALGITQSRMGEYSLLLSAWAKADPLSALQYAKENTTNGYASNTILATWASLDPDAALRWAEANYEGEGANPYLAGIIRGIAENNPTRATQLLEGMPYGEQRGEALAGMMQHILKQGPEAARSWISAIPDERLKGGAMMRMSDSLAEIDPKGTAEWLVQNPGEAADRRLDNVYETWAKKDQAAALASVAALPAGEQRTNAFSGIISSAASTDPQRALALMSQYPNDVNDGVVRDFVWNSFNNDPSTAASQIARIGNENERNQTYRRLLDRWIDTDVGKAQAWLQSNALPENVVNDANRRIQRRLQQ